MYCNVISFSLSLKGYDTRKFSWSRTHVHLSGMQNTINLSRYPNLMVGMVIECDHCGMTLLVKEIKGASVITEIVDEGK